MYVGSLPLTRLPQVELISTAAPPPSPVGSSPPANAGALFWRFEVESSPGTFPDVVRSSPIVNLGSTSSGSGERVQLVPGLFGQAARLWVGVNVYMLTAPNWSFNFANPFTLNIWVRLAGAFAGERAIATVPGRWALWINGSALNFYLYNGVTLTGVPAPVDQWQMITCAYDGATMRLWVNGAPVAPMASSFSPSGQPDWFIGAFDPFSGNLRGLVDCLLVYPAVLTQAQVDWLYNAGAGRDAPWA